MRDSLVVNLVIEKSIAVAIRLAVLLSVEGFLPSGEASYKAEVGSAPYETMNRFCFPVYLEHLLAVNTEYER